MDAGIKYPHKLYEQQEGLDNNYYTWSTHQALPEHSTIFKFPIRNNMNFQMSQSSTTYLSAGSEIR
jgi:hypothetical protein